MRDSLVLSPWRFNNLNSCNGTKVSLLNAQTHLRDLHMETSKGGKWGQTREASREKCWHKPGHSPRAQSSRWGSPRLQRNQVVADLPFSLEEQSDWVGTAAGVSNISCAWAQWPGRGWRAEVQPWLFHSQHSRQRNKAMELACPP